MHYVMKFEFSTESLLDADIMRGELHDRYIDAAGEMGPTFTHVSAQLVPGDGISNADIAANREFDSQVQAFMNAGHNSAPLPEGMPEV
jgi:hypothetical protein